MLRSPGLRGGQTPSCIPNLHTFMLRAVDKLQDPHGGDQPFRSIQRIMIPGVIQIPGDVSVQEAAVIMHKEHTPCLIVKDSDTKQGIVTYTDIVQKVVAQGYDPAEIEAHSIMSKPIHTIEFDQPIEAAISLMTAKGIPLLIVTKQKKPLGILTAGELALSPSRSDCRIPARVTIHGGNFHGSTHEARITHLTHLGAVLEMPVSLAPGTSLSMEFSLPGVSRPLLAHATIVRPPSPKERVGTGRESSQANPGPPPFRPEIQFSRLSPPDQAHIASWAIQNRHKQSSER